MKKLQTNFHELLSLAVGSLRNPVVDSFLKLQIVECLTMNYQITDHPQIEKLDLLKHLATLFSQETNNEVPPELATGAWTAFCLITISLWNKNSAEVVNSSTHNLRQQSLNIIFHQLKLARKLIDDRLSLLELNMEAIKNDKKNQVMEQILETRFKEVDKNEQYSFEILSLLLYVSKICPPQYLSLPSLSEDLLSFIEVGSPRIQRTVMYLLQGMVSCAEPSSLEPVVINFLEMLGVDLFRKISSEFSSHHSQTIRNPSSVTASLLTVQIVMLLRHLQNSDYKFQLVVLILQSLQNGLKCLSSTLQDNSETLRFLGALQFLGLNELSPRIGGKVEVSSEEGFKGLGSVVDYSLKFGVSKVLFGKNVDKKMMTISLAEQNIQPISEVNQQTNYHLLITSKIR